METLTFLGMGDLTGVDRAPEPTSSGATSPVLFGTISSIATIPGLIGTTSVAAATPGLFCAASSAASKLGRFSGATTGSVHAPVCVSSGTNSVVTATYKSTGWQPDYDGVTSDSPAPRVFEGMPTPCHGMSSGIVSSLQWNQSNSHTGQDHQMLDTSSCFDYGTSAMTWSYCPTLQGRVLSVVMHQVKHPVPIGVLNHLFSLYGVVETIFQSLNQHGRKVLIQYKHGYMADNALRATHGWYLYRTYCQLDIRHADHTELQTLADYSCALFSEINDDADHLCHESTAMPQNEVSDCSQLVTLYMKGHTLEQEVQPNIPAFNVVTIATHEQKQPDGKHDASTVPNERVIEQSTLMQVLDELPSFHAPKVAVQLCSSEVVQAATMVGQGNPASSTQLVLHVDDPQLPTSAQDASDLFKEMPVFDVYEEDTNGSLNFVVELCDTSGQHKQYDREKPIYDHEEPHGATKLSSWEPDNERLAVCFNTTYDNAFSEEATNFTFLHGPVIHADRPITLTTEKSTQAASILCAHEVIVNSHDERSEINIKKQEVLISKHAMISPCDLNTDKVSLISAPCIWDPGIDLFSYKNLHLFIWIPLSAIPPFQQLHMPKISSMWDFSLKRGRQVQWDPGIDLHLYEFWRLQTMSKGTVYAVRHLFSVKFGTHDSTYFSDTDDIMWCPLPNLLQHGINVAEELHFCRSIFKPMHYWQICHKWTTMSSLLHCDGIPLWLINFQVP